MNQINKIGLMAFTNATILLLTGMIAEYKNDVRWWIAGIVLALISGTLIVFPDIKRKW